MKALLILVLFCGFVNCSGGTKQGTGGQQRETCFCLVSCYEEKGSQKADGEDQIILLGGRGMTTGEIVKSK